MNRIFRYLFFGLAAVVLQTYLIPSIGIGGQRPDLIVIFALTAGIFEGSSGGSLAGFLAGLAVDLYHPPTFGAGAIAGTVAGYLGGWAQTFLDLDHVLNRLMAYAGAHAVHTLLFAIVASLQGTGPAVKLFIANGFGGAVYTALVGAIVLMVVGLVRGRKHIVDRR
ncbi:rod shape-determining protein MreD [Gemmatimonadota bacterium]